VWQRRAPGAAARRRDERTRTWLAAAGTADARFPSIMRYLIALSLTVALAGCVGSGGVRYGAHATVYTPELVEIEPGVRVVVDYDEPVFYSDGAYWRYYAGVWYRSPQYNRGWIRVSAPPIAVRRIERPERYVHYRAHARTRVRSDQPALRRDDREIRRDQAEVRRDLKELQRDQREIEQDRARGDRAEEARDRAEKRRDARELKRDREELDKDLEKRKRDKDRR
jgi:hypothetical protein